MIRTKLAHYEITSHIGSGGMGDVYQATDTKLGRSVAIKFLPDHRKKDCFRDAQSLSVRAAAGGIALVNVNSSVGRFAGPYIVGARRQQFGSYGSGMITLAVGLALGCVMAPRATMTRLRAGSGA